MVAVLNRGIGPLLHGVLRPAYYAPHTGSVSILGPSAATATLIAAAVIAGGMAAEALLRRLPSRN